MKPEQQLTGLTSQDDERQRRWRLVLGEQSGLDPNLSANDAKLDQLLEQLYVPGEQGGRSGYGHGYGYGGYGRSLPKAALWFKDIRSLFPDSAATIIQNDALERLDMASLLQDPAFLEAVEPDVNMVANLLMMKDYIPDAAKENARKLVKELVEQLLKHYRPAAEQSIRGAINRATRNNRPRPSEVNWNATIRKNLKHWQPEEQIIFPERLVGYGRRQRKAKQVILCVDQSGSMADSVIYSSIFAAVISSIPSIRTQLVVFDTEIVDLTEELQDPVDMLFGIQLGGGTDIAKALTYCESLITNPSETQLILISDLYENGDKKALVQCAQRIIEGGTNLVTLLALSDDGAPISNRHIASQFTALGSPAFACTPDLFPPLMAAALERRDLHQFASSNNLPVVTGEE
ncbi:MAG: VWA domain-containing protein [Marinobacterium sp.]